MAFVCVNHKLCALHDAYSVPWAAGPLARAPASFSDAERASAESFLLDSASEERFVHSQRRLQRDHGVPSEHAHGAFYVFLVATVFNANAALWSTQKGRSRLNLQVAYISAVAAYTHFEMWLGRDWFVTVQSVGLGGVSGNEEVLFPLADATDLVDATDDANDVAGVSFSALRVLEWVFTTPVLLLLVQHLHEYAFAELPSKETASPKHVSHSKASRVRADEGVSNESAFAKNETASDGRAKKNDDAARRERRRSASAYAYVPVNKFLLIAADEAMIACGVLMPVFPYGAERFALLCVSMLCFCFVIAHSVFAIVDIMLHAEIDFADGCRLFAIAALKVIAWSGYPLVYFLTEYRYLTVKQQHEFYLYNDVLTKFSYSLMISAGSLRCIDLVEEHKQKIATQMSQAQRAFFFNVTHELRTPLNSIIGFNTLAMESGELTNFTNSFIKASLTSAEALLGLINQILDFAKFEGAKDAGGADGASAIELSEDVWTVRQLMEQVTDMTQKATSAFDGSTESVSVEAETTACSSHPGFIGDPKSRNPSSASRASVAAGDVSAGDASRSPKNGEPSERRPDVVVTLATPEHFNTAFVGDFFRLRQCCVNLVDNAVKYSTGVVGRDALVELVVTVTEEERDARREIGVARKKRASTSAALTETETDEEDAEDFFDFAHPFSRARITFEVRDNGVGIPAAKQHALFVPFCQPAEHRAAKEKGTGLGLVITKSIVECMGGEIDFVSVEDVGTRFFFTVAFRRANAKDAPVGVSGRARARRQSLGVQSAAEKRGAEKRGSVDAVLDAGAAGGLAGSDGSEPTSSDGEETYKSAHDGANVNDGPPARFEAEAPRRPRGDALPLSDDDAREFPSAARVVVHPSMRAATRRHAVNILKCFRAQPGSNYAVCKSLADVQQKFAQAKRLGAPVVFVEAREDADATARLVEAVTSPDGVGSESKPEEGSARRVSFSPGLGAGAPPEKSSASFERGVVVFGRPRQLMELRKRLGRREDVACVFEPAKPSEVLRATRRLTETLLAAEQHARGGGVGATRAVDLAGYGFDAGGRRTRSPTKAEADAPTRSSTSPRGASPPGGDENVKKMSVLLAEDNRLNQQMVEHSVAKCGVALDIVGDGAAAVALVTRRLREGRVYDAILMDMMMPVMDGASATREIRAAEALLAKERDKSGTEKKKLLRHVIIGLSANVGPAFAAEVRAAGMDGVVSKPFYPKTLRRALLEVRAGAYAGFAEESLGEGPGSSPADDADGTFLRGGDDGKDGKRVRRASSSGAA